MSYSSNTSYTYVWLINTDSTSLIQKYSHIHFDFRQAKNQKLQVYIINCFQVLSQQIKSISLYFQALHTVVMQLLGKLWPYWKDPKLTMPSSVNRCTQGRSAQISADKPNVLWSVGKKNIYLNYNLINLIPVTTLYNTKQLRTC